MSKKSFNDIEQLIKKLADGNEPPFDEQAWLKMEVLLNKEGDRKRPIAWLWWLLPIFIGAGIGSYFIFSKNNNAIQNMDVEKNNVSFNSTPSQERAKNNAQTSISLPSTNTGNNINNHSSQPPKQPDNLSIVQPKSNEATSTNRNTVLNNVSNSKNSKKKLNNYTDLKKVSSDEVNFNNINKNTFSENTVASTKKLEKKLPTDDVNFNEINKNAYSENTAINTLDPVKKQPNETPELSNENLQKTELAKSENIEKEAKSDSVTGKVNASKINKGKTKGFYFITAAGMEVNGVHLFSSGKITSRIGLSAGYQFSKHFSVQTGFYSSSKKYVAGPDDYTTKKGTYWNIVQMTKIDADCKVYEIPLLLRYDFTNNHKFNFFTSAGLSSFIMKDETYHYYYKKNSVPHDAIVSYYGNEHFFSVVRIAAGIETNITKQFSINLVPGFSIPLSGVGEGKVKLYSTDLMLGVKFTPFRKK